MMPNFMDLVRTSILQSINEIGFIKGQLILKCPFGAKSTKKPTKFLLYVAFFLKVKPKKGAL